MAIFNGGIYYDSVWNVFSTFSLQTKKKDEIEIEVNVDSKDSNVPDQLIVN